MPKNPLQNAKLTASTKTAGKRITRNSKEEVYYSAELNEVTGEYCLTGDCPDHDIDGEDFFLTDDGREYKVCARCYKHIIVNGSCLGKMAKKCKPGW